MDTRRLREITNWLRKEFPLDAPVAVSQQTFSTSQYADCWKSPKSGRFKIRLNSEIDALAATFILMHEWAHALLWSVQEVSKPLFDHDDLWGVTYARIWRAYSADQIRTGGLHDGATAEILNGPCRSARRSVP